MFGETHNGRKLARVGNGARRRVLFMAVDAALISAAYVVAYVIRFEGVIPAPEAALLWKSLPLVVVSLLLAMEMFGLYRRVWRHAGVADLTRVVSALSVGALSAGVLIFLFNLRGHSRLVFVAFYALAVLFIVGFRVGVRNLGRLSLERRRGGMPCLVAGSGDTGEAVIREFQRNPALLYRPVGIVTDVADDVGLRIRNVPVVGTTEDLPALIADLDVKEVVVADPDLGGEEFKRIVQHCAPSGTTVRIFPSAGDLLGGRVEVSRIRKVDLADLLRRRPVPPDLFLMERYLRGKRVLVTGAGGSIGSELCRQTCRANPAELIMVDRVENSLYEIDLEIGERFPDLPRRAQLADIRSIPRMEEILVRFRPEIVFHAAAFKHVPLMEAHPGEVVLNNIVGTAKLAQLALAHGVSDFVLISSDKAVNPVNVMGVSKRITELYMQHLANGPAKGRTKFLAVRFGNVLGSAGSLIPLLKRQIEKGGPVTITHPQMTRYFMTISEAVELVIEASAMSDGGEIFVLDMGEPVNVVDLAKDMITLSGLEPGRDIPITFTGLRPGEKLDEQLWSDSEQPQPTANPKITALRDCAVPDATDLDGQIDELAVLAEQGRVTPMIHLLRAIVPEFSPQLLELVATTAQSVMRYHVLVADDDPDLRNLMSVALRRAGLEVTTAEDGVSALEKLTTLLPHLAVLDIMMPGLDGLALFEQLKSGKATRHIPVMLVTAYPEIGERAKSIEYEADDFISKPFRVSEFVRRVQAILHRRYRQVDAPAARANGSGRAPASSSAHIARVSG